MAKQRTTFGKRQRELDKQAKQAAKREKRTSKDRDEGDVTQIVDAASEKDILAALDKLHESYEAGDIDQEAFEEARAELYERLVR